MALIKKMKKKEVEEMPEKAGPKDLATAMAAAKQGKRKAPKTGQIPDMPPKAHEGMSTDKRPDNIAQAIMQKRQMLSGGGKISYVNRPNNGFGAIVFKAEGGMVGDESDSATDASNLEQPNMMDELNESALKENYSEAPEMEPEDAKDMISAIRSKLHAKRMFR